LILKNTKIMSDLIQYPVVPSLGGGYFAENWNLMSVRGSVPDGQVKNSHLSVLSFRD